jgi:HlyD family secretion protein
VRIVTWEAADVLKVPTSALFREGERWAVYSVEGDRARRTIVEVGHQTGEQAEITGGLSVDAHVILHPGGHARRWRTSEGNLKGARCSFQRRSDL